MKKLIVLGTGHAVVKKCYNTCFALQEDNEYLLVDAGGGNEILNRLDKANIPLIHIHHMFVTHEHTDHILGVVWIIRMIASLMKMKKYEGKFHIYCHKDLVQIIQTICCLTLSRGLTCLFDDMIIFHGLENGDTKTILNCELTFFDIYSTKAKQFGFTFRNENNEKIVFLGDEPYNPKCYQYCQQADWLLHEAFCLYEKREIYKPYEKHHSTTKDASEVACQLNAKHLVLWHSEDDDLKHRKEMYTKEAKQYFNGEIFVPDDLEIIDLIKKG